MTWTSNRGQDGFDGLLFVVCDFRPRLNPGGFSK
jgi:hypothetical protein